MSSLLILADSDVFGVWYLMSVALVFFMQAGFAMVESGFTRAKNTGNIVMKNLMDFCLGTIAFVLIGAPLLIATEAVGGLFGNPVGVWGDLFGDPSTYNWSGFVFNLVFCATAATIVSGAMAERTNFKAYCIYSLVISAIIYPVEAFWVWGLGENGEAISWLQKMAANFNVDGTALTFIDLSGSAAIHMVGGVTALLGAAILGPRIGKYAKKSDGTVEVKAIPGHNILVGALGCFILWFGWYGFNAAACQSIQSMSRVFMTTTVAASCATVATMMFTWIKNGKPDISMTLNGSLAGLVAITAGCASVDLVGSAIIGAVAGILVVVVVEVLDKKLHIDDPVGAIAVHFANGLWGTLACGLFSTTSGLFYTGSGWQLLIQFVGVVAILAYTVVCDLIMFFILTKIKRKDGVTPFLRATREEELKGLDPTEHGLASSYPDFVPMSTAVYNSIDDIDIPPLQEMPEGTYTSKTQKITKVSIIIRENKFEDLKQALSNIGVTGMTITQVMGCGTQGGQKTKYRGVDVEINLIPKIKVEVVICKVPVDKVVDAARRVLYTGEVGDGKIFVYDVENVIRVRTGETGYDALQDVE